MGIFHAMPFGHWSHINRVSGMDKDGKRTKQIILWRIVILFIMEESVEHVIDQILLIDQALTIALCNNAMFRHLIRSEYRKSLTRNTCVRDEALAESKANNYGLEQNGIWLSIIISVPLTQWIAIHVYIYTIRARTWNWLQAPISFVHYGKRGHLWGIPWYKVSNFCWS